MGVDYKDLVAFWTRNFYSLTHFLPRQSSYIEHGVRIPVFDQRGELPLLPFGNPIGFVPASRGGVYIEPIDE